jgi:hypothetical protein
MTTYDFAPLFRTAIDYPTFEDGLRGMILLSKVAESAAAQRWVTV